MKFKIADFKRLYAVAKEGKNIVIVGGGFLGSELACALAHVSKKYGGTVTQIYPETGNLSKILPEYLSKWTTKRVKEGKNQLNASLHLSLKRFKRRCLNQLWRF